MGNSYRITLDDASLRWAAAEGVPETVIAAICLLRERGVDEIVAKLTATELEQVIKIAGRSPQVYPPGVYAALKDKRDVISPPTPPPQVDSPPIKLAPKNEAMRPPEKETNERASRPQKAAALRRRAADDIMR